MFVRSFGLISTERLKPVFEISQRCLVANNHKLLLSKQFVNKDNVIVKHFNETLQNQIKEVRLISKKTFHTTVIARKAKNEDIHEEFDEKNSLMYNREFDNKESKDKSSFLEVVRIYKDNVQTVRGHVDFIKAALRRMREFGVHQNLTVYKILLDVLPKGEYKATNVWLAEFMHFPRHQFVALELVKQMERNGVEPDKEILVLMENIFGKLSYPYKRLASALYWYTKLKNKSPFYSPRFLPDDALLLAKIAVERMTRVDLQSVVSVYNTESVPDSIDKTWIVSGQSPKQKELLQKHPSSQPVIVEGGDLIWLKNKPVKYFTLRADCDPFPFHVQELDDITHMESMIFNPNYMNKQEDVRSVHEQDDGIIYGICVTGTSSKDSLLSWIRILQSTGNPILADVPVLFKFKTPEALPTPFSEEVAKKE